MTKNATSSNSVSSKLSLKKQERLCHKKGFDFLFEKGASFSAGRLRIIYSFDVPDEIISYPVMVAFAVSKRKFRKAVERNFVKRRMREAYRLQKLHLLQKVMANGQQLTFIILYSSRSLPNFDQVKKDTLKALKELSRRSTKQLEASASKETGEAC